MKLIELKPIKFIYCGKTYTRRRYITADKKISISYDTSNYAMVYKANSEGKGVLISDLYNNGNYSSYPIWTIEDAIKRIDTWLETNACEYELDIHPSQYLKQNKQSKS